MRCNGCGGEIRILGGVFSYGTTDIEYNDVFRDEVRADHHRTLCPRCQRVIKDMLLNSDLSDHWDKFDWEEFGDAYTEGYEDSTECSDSERGDASEGYE